MRADASQNCATELARNRACSGVRRATVTASCCAKASSRSARIRSNCADQAWIGYVSSGSSMSRIARAIWFRSPWMRSSSSESRRLRSVRSVCNCRSPVIWREMYHEYASTVASVTMRPRSSVAVGVRRKRKC